METIRINDRECVEVNQARKMAQALLVAEEHLPWLGDEMDNAVEIANELAGDLFVYRGNLGDEFKVEGFPMIFEAGRRLPDNWVEARRGCNTLYILTGSFERHTFNLDACRPATEEERETYFALKSMVAEANRRDEEEAGNEYELWGAE